MYKSRGKLVGLLFILFIMFSKSIIYADSNLIYEAEADHNTLTGNAEISNCDNCSGGKKVGNLYSDSSVTFNQVIVNEAGDYRVEVHYISGDPRSFYIAVNGEFEQYYNFPATKDWDTVGVFEITLPLQAGENQIMFSDGNWYSPDLDKIIIKERIEEELIEFEKGELGDLLTSKNFSEIEVAEYTNGFSLSTEIYTFNYYIDSGYSEYLWQDSVVQGIYSEIQLDDFITNMEYSTRSFTMNDIETIENDFGKGIRIAIKNTESNLPNLYQVFEFYADLDYFLTWSEIESDDDLSINYMAPFAMNNPGGIDLGNNSENRILFVPFDNDMWIRYQSYPINSESTSYEVTTIYNNQSRNGLVVGSIIHDLWKTGINWSGSNNQLNKLIAYGGASSDITRDTVPHGSITGKKIQSPTMFVGFFEDYRDGLEEYGKANAIIAPPLEFHKDLFKGVPIGWNSWGAHGSNLSYKHVIAASEFFKNNLKEMNNEGVTYINLDSYWDFLSDEELASAVQLIQENKQEPGIYWGPFVYWGDNMSQHVEGTNQRYTYGDILLKDESGNYLPTLDGAYALDPTHPGTKERIDYYLNKFLDLKFTYIKLDFVTHAALEGDHFDPNIMTGIQAYNHGMKYVRDVIDGKMFISSSISPMFPNQYTHSRRIATDTFGSIGDTEYQLNALTYGWWQSGTIYHYTDPDHMTLGAAESLEEARTRVNSAVISGTVFLNSDDVNDPVASSYMEELYSNKEIIELVRKGKVFRPVEGDRQTSAATTFVLKDDEDYYVAVFNYDSNEGSESVINLERIGAQLNQPYQLIDLWSGEESTVENEFLIELEQKSSTILKLTNKDDGEKVKIKVTLSANKTSMKQDDTVELTVGILSDRTEDDLGEANISYFSSEPDDVTIHDNGELRIQNNPVHLESFDVWAIVELENQTVKSNTINIKIEKEENLNEDKDKEKDEEKEGNKDKDKDSQNKEDEEQDINTSGEGNHNENDDVESEDESKKEVETDFETKLPNTATNTFNIILIGTIMFITSILSLIFYKRKKFIP